MRDLKDKGTCVSGNLVAAAVAIIEQKNSPQNGTSSADGTYISIESSGSLRRVQIVPRDYGKNSTEPEGVDTSSPLAGKSAFTNLRFSAKNNHCDHRSAGSDGESRASGANGKQSPAINGAARAVPTETGEGGEEAKRKFDDIFELAVQDFDLTAREVQRFVLESGNNKVRFILGVTVEDLSGGNQS